MKTWQKIEPITLHHVVPHWSHGGPLNTKSFSSDFPSEQCDAAVLTNNLPPTAFAFRQKKAAARATRQHLFPNVAPSLDTKNIFSTSSSQTDVQKYSRKQTQKLPDNCSENCLPKNSQKLSYFQVANKIVDRLSSRNLENKSPKQTAIFLESLSNERRVAVPKKSSLPSTSTNSSFSSGDSGESFGVLPLPDPLANPQNILKKRTKQLCERCFAELPLTNNFYDYVYNEAVSPAHVLQGLASRQFNEQSRNWLASSLDSPCLTPTKKNGRTYFARNQLIEEPVYEELADDNQFKTTHKRSDSFSDQIILHRPYYQRMSSSDSWLGTESTAIQSRQALLAKTDSGFSSETTPSSTVEVPFINPQTSTSDSTPSVDKSDFVSWQLPAKWPHCHYTDDFENRPRSEMMVQRNCFSASSDFSLEEPALRRCESLDVPLFAIDNHDTWSRGGESDSENSSGGSSNNSQMQTNRSRSQNFLTKIGRFLLK